MTTKEHLKNYRRYKDLIKQYDREIRAGDAPEPDAARAMRDSYVCLVEAIEKAIERLPNPTEQLLLRLRYIKGYSWTRVRFELHYSESQVKRYHRQALKRLEEVLIP